MINLISPRQRRILYIISNEEDYISSFRIANILGISTKTVMNDIKSINSSKVNECLRITSKRHVGYNLFISDEKKCSQLLAQIKKELNVSTEDKDLRMFQVLNLLLLNDGIIDFYTLQTKLYVSDSTLKSDLRVVREYLQRFDVQLMVQNDEVIRIVGSEFRKRLLITHFVNKSDIHDAKLDLLKNKYLVHDSVMPSVKEKVQYLLVKQSQLGLADEVISFLAHYIVVSTVRIKLGHMINQRIDLDISIFYNYEVLLTNSIIQYITTNFNATFTEHEFNYLLLLIISYSNPKNILKMNMANETIRAARRVIDVVCEFTGEDDLRNDMNFNEQVYTYLYSKRIRSRFGIYYDYLPMNLIKRKRISGIEVSIRVCELLEKDFGMQFDYREVILFSLCFGNVFLKSGIYNYKRKIAVVSKFGLIEARRISEMIRVMYALYIESIDLYDSFEVPSLPDNKYDFIITDDEKYKQNRVYFIEPLTIVNEISDELKNKIQNRINGTSSLLKMLEGNIYSRLKLTCKRDVFKFVSKFVSEDKQVTDAIINQLYDRNHKISYEVGNKFAVITVQHSSVKATQLIILVLSKPIHWDKQEVSIIQVLLTSGKDTTDYRYVGGSMCLLTNNIEFINEFINQPTVNVIKKYIQ